MILGRVFFTLILRQFLRRQQRILLNAIKFCFGLEVEVIFESVVFREREAAPDLFRFPPFMPDRIEFMHFASHRPCVMKRLQGQMMSRSRNQHSRRILRSLLLIELQPHAQPALRPEVSGESGRPIICQGSMRKNPMLRHDRGQRAFDLLFADC